VFKQVAISFWGPQNYVNLLVVGFVKSSDLLVPFLYESHERCGIVLNVPCKYYVCRCE
jgi:hypothetical protein